MRSAGCPSDYFRMCSALCHVAAELSAADMIMKGHSAPYTQPRHKKKALLKRLMHTIRNHLCSALSENIEVCVVVRDVLF